MVTLLISTLLSFAFAQGTVGNGLHSEHAGHSKKILSRSDEKTLVELRKKAKVSFVEPKDRAMVGPKFKVKVAVEGMKLKQAGTHIEDLLAGHVHVIVDGAAIAAGAPIPMNETHLHFLTGSDESEISLKPGVHKLTVQMADGAHRSLGPAVSQTIQITVQEEAKAK